MLSTTFTSAETIPVDARVTGCAEVSSPNDSRREAHATARVWLSRGTRLVWVVHPETPRRPALRTPLDGLDVLPGSACGVSAVFGPRAPGESPGR